MPTLPHDGATRTGSEYSLVLGLVHHVELNRAGWWERALNRLVLGVVWLAAENPSAAEIQSALQTTFGLAIGTQKLQSILCKLEAEDCLVRVSEDRVRIPDKARALFEREIAEAEGVEQRAREFFLSLAKDICPALDATVVWNAFESNALVPLIRDIGASTYSLVAGKGTLSHDTYAERFMEQFGREHRTSLRTLATSFLDPKRADVRNLITRMLHAEFCIESSGVSDAVLERLKQSLGKPLRFRLFVDTNFLFSLLGLHENPSNASARELKELLATLKDSPQVQLCITPKTINEAKGVIAAAKAQVSGVPMGRNFTEAALRAGMSGMNERYFIERKRRGLLTPNDWFDPYLRDFVSLARAAGIELHNENLDAYGTRQDVIDDIHLVMAYEKKHLPDARRKSYERIAHDIILWHVVKDRRPAYVESPMDAEEWILTVDFRLLGFDAHKLKRNRSNVPMCLHPTSLVQLLQFWIPRTQEFEEAMLGGLRLPFLFQEFDAKAERTSLHIIKRLGHFHASEEIPGETLLRVVLNENLRSRIDEGQPEEQEIQLVRDALVEEMRARAEAEEAKVEELTKETQLKDAEIEELQKKLDTEEAKSRTADEKLSEIAEEQSKLEGKMAQMEKERRQRNSLLTYLALLIVVVAVSSVGAWRIGRALSGLSKTFGPAVAYAAIWLGIFVMAHLLLELLIGRQPRYARLWPFSQVRRFRRWLWMIAGALVLGVAGNLIAERIHEAKVARPADGHSTRPNLSNSPEGPTETGNSE